MSGLVHHAARLMEQGRGWAGLGGDSLAYVIAGMATGGQWLVVVDEPDMAERMVRALRFFYDKPDHVVLFGADDTRPYDGFSPDVRHPRGRLRALDRVDTDKPVVVVAPARALAQRVPDVDSRKLGRKRLEVGGTLDRDHLVRWLTDNGYLASDRVHAEGFYAVRGDIVDVWPAGRVQPMRVDFFDDEIEDIRRLEPGTLRTEARQRKLRIIAAKEERLDRACLTHAATALARLSTLQKRDTRLRRRVLEDLRSGVRFAGVEALLPALMPVQDPLDAMSGLKLVVVHPDEVAAVLRDFERQAHDRYNNVDDDERPLVPPEDRYVPAANVLERLADGHVVHNIARKGSVDLGARTTDGFGVRGTELSPALKRLEKLAYEGAAVALVCSSQRRANHLMQMLEPHGMFPTLAPSAWDVPNEDICLLVGDLPRGFLATDSNLIFLPDTALFGAHRRRQVADRVHAFFDAALTSLHQIKEGDYIVHKLHGVGLYLGLERMDVGVGEQDYAKLEYRGGDILYLPLSYLSLLSRYVPAKKDAKIKLDRLGGQTWEARQGKVRDSLLAMAEELLRIQAKRKLAERPPFLPGGDLYHQLVASFEHDETPDQATAIDAVQDDLSGDRPMDRLLCGDVGFGKTEVAMRAAARVVEAGFQVAVLCPTTVLAYQHVQTFRARFQGLPVNVAMLSRFNTSKQSADVLAKVKAGEVDILIGTTSILGRTVRFPNLGLMVIDEEHRFGVKQKARLKKMRIAVDVLSMSATPIPRTLQMGLSGMRDMSLIATAPKDRLAVRTSVSTLKEIRIRDAVMHELDRKGQVFFVHNRVESINQMGERLREWIPEARIEVAHGQMSAKQLEAVLVRFTQHEFDVLVCTSIMETGIDLPNVNTMVVNRADQFGLAQLYQLRGRVGRGAVRASCLLLLPEGHTKDARRRVQVMVENTQLGAGFSVAAADLEIRGAGNLIGEAQSGNIDAVGYEVWLELLEQAVHRARGEMEAGQIDPDIEVPVPAFIPEQMVKDTQERLAWYRKISAARTVRQVELALEDLEMERGELPREVMNLGSQAMSRLYCKELGIVRCSFLSVRVVLEFHPGSKVPKQRLIDFAATKPRRYSVNDTPGEPLTFEARFTDSERDRPYRYLRWLFVQLQRDGK